MRLGDPKVGRPVAELIELVFAVVQRHLGGGRLGADAEPPGNQVRYAFGHQAIGGDLAADDAGKAGDPVALFVVDDREVAAHLAPLGLRAEVVQGPHAGIGAHGTCGGHAVQHLGAFVDQHLHLIPFDGQYFGVGDLDRRGAQDGDTQAGDDDVAVARLVAAIDRRVRQAPREDDHDAFDRNDLDLDIEQAGDEPRPGAGGVDHRLAADGRLFTGHRVPSQHA